jgi:hypothetical protein
MSASLCSGSQEEHGRIYYTPLEKAKQNGRPHQAFFRELVPQYSVLTNSFYYVLPSFPTLDNLRNFLLTTTTEVLSFFQQLRETP